MMEVTAAGTLVGLKVARASASRRHQGEVPKLEQAWSHGLWAELTRQQEKGLLTRAPHSEHGQEMPAVVRHGSREADLAVVVQQVEEVGTLERRRESRAGS